MDYKMSSSYQVYLNGIKMASDLIKELEEKEFKPGEKINAYEESAERIINDIYNTINGMKDAGLINDVQTDHLRFEANQTTDKLRNEVKEAKERIPLTTEQLLEKWENAINEALELTKEIENIKEKIDKKDTLKELDLKQALTIKEILDCLEELTKRGEIQKNKLDEMTKESTKIVNYIYKEYDNFNNEISQKIEVNDWKYYYNKWENAINKLETETKKMHETEPKKITHEHFAEDYYKIEQDINYIESLIEKLENIEMDTIKSELIPYEQRNQLEEKTNSVILKAREEIENYKHRASIGPEDARDEALWNVKRVTRNIGRFKRREINSKLDNMSRLALEEMLNELDNEEKQKARYK